MRLLKSLTVSFVVALLVMATVSPVYAMAGTATPYQTPNSTPADLSPSHPLTTDAEFTVGSAHTDFGTENESTPTSLSDVWTVGSGTSASVVLPDDYVEGFEEEPADSGLPDGWVNHQANSSEVQTAIVHDGSQAVRVVSDNSKAYSNGIEHDLTGPTTANASAWIRHGGGYVTTFELRAGLQNIQVRYFGDTLETQSGTTITTGLDGGWLFVRIYAIDAASDTYSVYWENSSASGRETDIPMNNGLSGDYDTIRMGNVNGEMYFDTVTVASAESSGSYLSANHSVSDAAEGWTNLTLDNASATVEWQAYDGTQWQVVNSSTFTTSGNHTLDISGTDYSKWRVNVTFEKTGANPTAELHDEGVLATNTTCSSTPTTVTTTTTKPDGTTITITNTTTVVDGRIITTITNTTTTPDGTTTTTTTTTTKACRACCGE